MQIGAELEIILISRLYRIFNYLMTKTKASVYKELRMANTTAKYLGVLLHRCSRERESRPKGARIS